MKRWLIIVACFFLSPPTQAWETELNLYRPFIRLDEGLLRISQTVEGKCLKASEKIVRPNAWRCQSHDKILDPCFINASTDKKQMICPRSPWQSTAVLLKAESLTSISLHAPVDMSKNLPWALELEGGLRCLRSTQSGYIDNLPVNYQCQNHYQLIGGIHRCKEQWTSLLANQQEINEVAIKKVWF